MGNKVKPCSKKQRGEPEHKFPVHCQCNHQQYDNSFPHDDLSPPAPPNGREDLWDLQFCRWWGWNWVRRRGAEATFGSRTDEVKATKCNITRYEEPSFKPERKCDRKVTDQGFCGKFSQLKMDCQPLQTSYKQPIRRQGCNSTFPPKKHFRDMCKCLLGKRQNRQCGGMANLYNTPSCSMVALEKLSDGVAGKTEISHSKRWSRCSKNKKKTRQEQIEEDQCQAQSWSKPPDCEKELSEENIAEEVYDQKNFSSTEESIEYLSVRVQHIKSDICCPCRKHSHSPPTIDQKCEDFTEKFNLHTQTSFRVPQDHKETQTCRKTGKNQSFQQDCSGGENLFKLKGKKHKSICICICCCGTCKSTDKQKIISDKSSNDMKLSLTTEKILSPKSSYDMKLPLKSDNTYNCPNQSSCSRHDYPVTYPLIVPPSNTKMFSKFGTPSKNYPWMQSMRSDATTITLNNLETYKSPASGKTYEFTTCDFNSHENITLPELIDITEDLSYLKKLENSTNKSENESRLLLDAVCDAILSEHNEKSSKFIDEYQLQDTVNETLNRNYKDLELLCDLPQEVPSKSDVHTELSKTFFNEDVGVQLTNPSNMKISSNTNVNFGNIDIVKGIVENIYADLNTQVQKNDVHISNLGPLCNSKANKNEPSFTFKATADVFTKTGLLQTKINGLHKKNIKREAPDSAKDKNCTKKLKQEHAGKLKSKEINNRQTPDKIGTIFTKIEDIVKQSKVKSAEIQKALNCMPLNQEPSYEFSESILATHCFGQNRSAMDLEGRKIIEMDINSSKRFYQMSSEAFQGANSSEITKTGGHKKAKKSYDFFSDKLDNFLDQYTKSCSGITSAIKFENKNTNSDEENKMDTTIYRENAKTISLEKVPKLSIQSFIVCDEKSTVTQKPFNGSAKTEKKVIKKKKVGNKASFIPIRKQGSGGNINEPL